MKRDHRSRLRSIEHQEAAEQSAYETGLEHGISLGREQMAFEYGFKQGVASSACHAYTAGYNDGQAHKPRAHRPHEMPDNASDLLDDHTHE